MSLLTRFRTKPEQQDVASEPYEPVSASSWTAGRAWISKLLSILVVTVMCGGGLLGAAAFAAVMTDTESAVVEAGVDGLTPEQQEAAAFASSYVGAWLSATRSEPGAFGDLADDVAISHLGETATTYRQLQVATVNPEPGGEIAVVLTAWVEELDMSGGGEDPVTRWVLRAYGVVVTATGAGLTVLGLPSPAAVPDLGISAPEAYGVSLTGSDPLFASVTEFLSAYAAGVGDLSRYVTPGTELSAISPPVAADVAVHTVLAVDAPAEQPTDGDQAHVYVEATFETVDGRATPVTYTLTLTARADRWEVTSIDPIPIPDTES